MEVSTSSMSLKPEQMHNQPPMILSPRFQPQTRSPQHQHHHHHDQHHQHLSNPYPTTFVQADTSTFKQVVQMLTGSSTDTTTGKHHESSSPLNKGGFSIPPMKKSNSFKLYERRQNNNNNMSVKNDLMINTLRLQNSQRLIFSSGNNHQSPRFSPRNSSSESIILSPSMLDFPKLGLGLNSPVTPLRSNDDPFNKSSPLSLGNSSSEEDKAIAEKGFYLHPSPVSTPRESQPLLLPLFPLNSPASNP